MKEVNSAPIKRTVDILYENGGTEAIAAKALLNNDIYAEDPQEFPGIPIVTYLDLTTSKAEVISRQDCVLVVTRDGVCVRPAFISKVKVTTKPITFGRLEHMTSLILPSKVLRAIPDRDVGKLYYSVEIIDKRGRVVSVDVGGATDTEDGKLALTKLKMTVAPNHPEEGFIFLPKSLKGEVCLIGDTLKLILKTDRIFRTTKEIQDEGITTSQVSLLDNLSIGIKDGVAILTKTVDHDTVMLKGYLPPEEYRLWF